MKILVRGTNWIGDSVMTVPTLRALRSVFPQAEIVLHTRASTEGIFRDADFLDRIITIDSPESNLNQVVEQAKRLRGERFDLAMILPNSFASALAARFAGIPRRFGYSKEMRRLFLTDPVAIPEWKKTRHEVYYYLELLKAVEKSILGTAISETLEPDTSVGISAERASEAREFLTRRGFDLSRAIVALGAGSTNSTAKRWPTERFALVASKLQKEAGANVLLLGSDADRAVSNELAKALDVEPLDLTGKTSIADAASLLSVSNLLISNDMGLAHLAPAVGTKTLVIFGPTDPVTTRPFSPLAEVIRHEVECSPCMLRQCPIDHRCMTRISVEQVFQAAIKALKDDE